MQRSTSVRLMIAAGLVLTWYTIVAATGFQVYLPQIESFPFPTATPTDTPAPTPIPTGVRILSLSLAVDSIGTRIISGEIYNNTGRNVEFVKLIANLYDRNNAFVGSRFTYAMLDIVRPGGRSPFQVYISDIDFTSYHFQVESTPTNDEPVDGLVLVSVGDRPATIEHWHYIYGQIQNTSSQPMKFVQAIATIYGADGKVVDAAYTYTQLDTLDPGVTSAFEILSTNWVGVPRYEVIVQGSH